MRKNQRLFKSLIGFFVVAIIALAVNRKISEARPGLTVGQDWRPWTMQQCLSRADAALRAEGLQTSTSPTGYASGVDRTYTVTISCVASGQLILYSVIVAADRGGDQKALRDRLIRRMNQGTAPPAGGPVAPPTGGPVAPPTGALVVQSNRDFVERSGRFGSNGIPDWAIRASFNATGTVTGVVINAGNSRWDTLPTTGNWAAAVEVGGRLMNRSDGSVNFPIRGPTNFTFYVENDGSLSRGNATITIIVQFSDGRQARREIRI